MWMCLCMGRKLNRPIVVHVSFITLNTPNIYSSLEIVTFFIVFISTNRFTHYVVYKKNLDFTRRTYFLSLIYNKKCY